MVVTRVWQTPIYFSFSCDGAQAHSILNLIAVTSERSERSLDS